MFIGSTQYQTNLVDVNTVRYLLCTNFYCKHDMIASLKEIIYRNIDCLGIEFSVVDYSYIVKIKKTAMRKFKGFDHNPSYYYQAIIPKIFKEYLSTHEQAVIQALRHAHPDKDPYQVLQYIYSNEAIMANLCHVTCISDNTLVIKL